MTYSRSLYIILFIGVLVCSPYQSEAVDLESRYAVIIFEDHDTLKRFNNELYMGRLGSQMRRNSGETIEDEVISKIDFIVEKVMLTLDMFLPQLKFSIVIHPDEKTVQRDFFDIYKVNVDYIAFYSPSRNTVFYSADNSFLRVVAHEIGHVVAENYFPISPPQRIHEVMAQYAEQHITD
nr:zinc metallopeptidase [Desulfobacula sp.]